MRAFDDLEWEWCVTTPNWQNPCGQYVRAWVDEAHGLYVTIAYTVERLPAGLPPWVWTLYSTLGRHEAMALDWGRARTVDVAVGEATRPTRLRKAREYLGHVKEV